jgi:YggT family protein
VLLYTLVDILAYLVWIVTVLVIVQFILSLLVAFNVVSLRNQFVGAVLHAINLLLDPILRPIRRIMPDTGAIDFSPLVLIVLLNILIKLLTGVALSTLA